MANVTMSVKTTAVTNDGANTGSWTSFEQLLIVTVQIAKGKTAKYEYNSGTDTNNEEKKH